MAMPVVHGLNGGHHLRMELCHLLVAWTVILGDCDDTPLSACCPVQTCRSLKAGLGLRAILLLESFHHGILAQGETML